MVARANQHFNQSSCYFGEDPGELLPARPGGTGGSSVFWESWDGGYPWESCGVPFGETQSPALEHSGTNDVPGPVRMRVCRADSRDNVGQGFKLIAHRHNIDL